MDPRVRLAAVMLLGVVLALTGLTACGGDDGQVKISSYPEATISVDGSEVGTTPQTLTLSDGTHEISLARDGFDTIVKTVEVAAGKTVEVEETLAELATEATLVELAKLLELEREPADAEPVMMRGGPREGIVLYWPQGKIRSMALRTYRVDVGEGYEGGGSLVFKLGRKVLHREAFRPQSSVVVESLPGAVLDNLKLGRSVTWGVEFEGRGRRGVLSKFIPSNDRSLEKRLAKLEKSKHYQRQHLSVQEILKADVLRSKRHNCEALIRYIAIAQTWPDGQSAYRGIMSSARGIGLEDTSLYAFAAENAGGVKGKGLPSGPNAASLRTSGKTPFATGRTSGARHVTEGPLAGPNLAAVNGEEVVEDPDAGEVAGEADGTAGETPAGAAGPAVAAAVSQLNEVANHLDKVAEDEAANAARLEKLAESHEQARRDIDDAVQACDAANQAAEAADEAVNAAQRKMDEAAGDPAAFEAAQQAVQQAEAAANEAKQKADEASQSLHAAHQRENDLLAEAGGDPKAAAENARAHAEEAARAAREAHNAANAAAGEAGAAGGVPDGLHTAARAIQDESRQHERTAAHFDAAARSADNVRNQMDQAASGVKAAQEARDEAENNVVAAREAFDATAGDPAAQADAQKAVEDAEKAVQDADEQLARANRQENEAQEAFNAHMRKYGVADADEARAKAEEAREAAAEAAKAAENARAGAEAAAGEVGEAGEAPSAGADPRQPVGPSPEVVTLRQNALKLEASARAHEDTARGIEAQARAIEAAEQIGAQAAQAADAARRAHDEANENLAQAQEAVNNAANPADKAAAEQVLQEAEKASQETREAAEVAEKAAADAMEAHAALRREAGDKDAGELFEEASRAREAADRALNAADAAREEAKGVAGAER